MLRVKKGMLARLYIARYQNLQIQTKLSQRISQNKEELCA